MWLLQEWVSLREIPKDDMTAMLQDSKRVERSVALVNILGGQ